MPYHIPINKTSVERFSELILKYNSPMFKEDIFELKRLMIAFEYDIDARIQYMYDMEKRNGNRSPMLTIGDVGTIAYDQ